MNPGKVVDLELCTDDLSAIQLAALQGYKRIELCSSIETGGITPGPGLISQTVRNSNIEIHVLLRHRDGDFIYTNNDLPFYLDDMAYVKQVGAKGVVCGCLKQDGSINEDFCRNMAQKAHDLDLKITFHRAFDFVPNPAVALEQLIDMGFDRILTSGRKPTALEGLDDIKRWVDLAAGQIEVMAGSGITETNALEIAATGVNALHFSAYQPTDGMRLGMGQNSIPDFEKIKTLANIFGSA